MKESSDKLIFLRDAEIFRDLTETEVDALGKKMPLKNVAARTVFYAPDEPTEVLFMNEIFSRQSRDVSNRNFTFP